VVNALGDKEVEAKTAAVRNTLTKKQESVARDVFVAKTIEDIHQRALRPSLA
jgi:threonyl-tRNA synthetase